MQAELQAKLQAETGELQLRLSGWRLRIWQRCKLFWMRPEAERMAKKKTESQADGSLKPAPAANWFAASVKNGILRYVGNLRFFISKRR